MARQGNLIRIRKFVDMRMVVVSGDLSFEHVVFQYDPV